MVLIKENNSIVVERTLKKVPLDEIELNLNLLKLHKPELVSNDKTYKEISESIKEEFGIECDEFDINLLHEPTIEEMEEDLRFHFNSMGIYY